MSFPQAVRTVLAKYVVFHGRARRSEFWWFALFNGAVGITALVLDLSLGTVFEVGTDAYGYFSTAVTALLLVPGTAVAVRRLHDIGATGWLVLIGLLPGIGWIIMTILAVQPSQSGENKHGPDPKDEGASSPATPVL